VAKQENMGYLATVAQEAVVDLDAHGMFAAMELTRIPDITLI